LCLLDSLLHYAPDFVVNWTVSRQGCTAANYLEFHMGYYDPLDYCTFGVEAASDAQTV